MTKPITELLECSICLQTYDHDKQSPRVLACGHTQCLQCLDQLPKQFTNSASSISSDCLIKCPECIQWVKFPARGASALPKNIQLLRLLPSVNSPELESSSSGKSEKANCFTKNSGKSPDIFQLPADRKQQEVKSKQKFSPESSNGRSTKTEHFFSARETEWFSWVIPRDAVELECSTDQDRKFGTMAFDFSHHCRKQRVRVSLIPLDIFKVKENSYEETGKLRLFVGNLNIVPEQKLDRYTILVLDAVASFSRRVRDELQCLKMVSVLHRNLCRLFGFWMSHEGFLYLVFERPHKYFADVWALLNDIENSKNLIQAIPSLLTVAVEICEVVMELHSFGLVCGTLAPECLGFDAFTHPLIDLSELIFANSKVKGFVKRTVGKSETTVAEQTSTGPWLYSSPEYLCMLENGEKKSNKNDNASDKLDFDTISTCLSVKADSWSLGCLLLTFLEKRCDADEDTFPEVFTAWGFEENGFNFQLNECLSLESLVLTEAASLKSHLDKFRLLLCRCFEGCADSRPTVFELWRSLKTVLTEESWGSTYDFATVDNGSSYQTVGYSLLYCPSKFKSYAEHDENGYDISGENEHFVKSSRELRSVSDTVGTDGSLESTGDTFEMNSEIELQLDEEPVATLKGHLDCVTAMVVYGDILFSSSYDKTICGWSLKTYKHLWTLRGHEHRILALVVDTKSSLCFSGDYGGCICVWHINSFPRQEPAIKWYDHKDWRYSGVHCLAISDYGYLYSGSGDKTIKAWCLQDYTLASVMEGHQSLVSSLVVDEGLLYSGSWDGTIRLWWLRDHSPLSVLGVNEPTEMSSVHALAICQGILAAAYANGCVKMWKDDNLLTSLQIHDGPVLALNVQHDWILTGSWDKTIKILDIKKIMKDAISKEVDCKSVVTSAYLYHGNLFVGLANKDIKVFSYKTNASVHMGFASDL